MTLSKAMCYGSSIKTASVNVFLTAGTFLPRGVQLPNGVYVTQWVPLTSFLYLLTCFPCVRSRVFVSVSETGWDRKCNHFSITTSPKVIDVMFTGTATCRAKTCRILISGSGTIQLRSKGAPQAVTGQLCALGDWRGLCRTDIQSCFRCSCPASPSVQTSYGDSFIVVYWSAERIFKCVLSKFTGQLYQQTFLPLTEFIYF